MESPPSYALVLTVFAVLFATTPALAATVEVDFNGVARYTIASNRYISSESSLISYGDTVGANLQLVTNPMGPKRGCALARSSAFDGTLGGVVFDSATLNFDDDPGLGGMEIVDKVSVTPVPEATAATAFGADSFAVGLARERNS
jgi:hypothetical protein